MRPPPPRAEELSWSIHRPPHPKLRLWSWLLGLAIAGAGAFLLQALQLQPGSWWLAIAVGTALGILVPLSVAGGATLWLTRDGQVLYGYGHHPQIRFALDTVHAARPVATGALHGLGLELDPGVVELLHRKGMSYATMRRWRRGLGVDLVLEHFSAADWQQVQERATAAADS